VLEASKEKGGYCILKIESCCVFAGHINLMRDKQLLENVILTSRKMTTHTLILQR